MPRSFPFFSSPSSRKARSQARRPTRLTFEDLEERRLMAIVAWGAQLPAAYVKNVAPAYVAPAYTASPVTPVAPNVLPSLPAGYATVQAPMSTSPAYTASPVTPATPDALPSLSAGYAAAVGGFDSSAEIIGVHNPLPENSPYRDVDDFDFELLPVEDDSAPAAAGSVIGDYFGNSPVIPAENPIDLSHFDFTTKPDIPYLDSNPNAQHTLYLNFTGSRSRGSAPSIPEDKGGDLKDHRVVFDMDGDSRSFSAAEHEAMTRIWQYVADDYAPFNVNVTTYSSNRNPSSPDDYVLEVAIGGIRDTGDDYSLWGKANELGAYRNGDERAVYVFSGLHYLQSKSFLSGPDYFVRSVADTISHEAGHAYGLAHQSELVDDEWVKREPSGNGTSLLMGIPFIISPLSGFRSLWSWGEDDLGQTQDDLSILTDRFQYFNGDGLRKDNVPDHFYKPLPEVQTGHFHAAGFIGINQADPSALDEDWFAFKNPGGPMQLRLHSPVGTFGNLQSRIELWTAHNTPNGMVEDRLVHESWSSSWQNGFGFASLPAGEYMVLVSSTGGYGNLGSYVLDITAYSSTGGLKAGGPNVVLTGMTTMSYAAGLDTADASLFEQSLAPRFLGETGNYQTQSWIEGGWTEGFWTDGTASEGFWTDGNWTDGSWMEGYWTDGFWTDGTSTEGYWTDGNWTDGFWTDGSWIDGYWGDGAWVDGYWNDGHWTDGSWTDGFWTRGTATEGFWTDGHWTDGSWMDGSWTDGFWTDGTETEGFWTDGLWTEGYWADVVSDRMFEDLEWAALNPLPLLPTDAKAEIAAIDEAILAFSEEQWSALYDDALLDMLAELAV